MKIGSLKKLKKNDLIILLKQKGTEIRELKKDIKREERKWRNYYRGKLTRCQKKEMEQK